MTLFDERERAFENLYAHDEELRFLALARRNRLFAEWAAEQIGFRGKEYEAYVRSFVDCAVLPECEDALIGRVREDFIANGVETTDARTRVAMMQAAARAAREVRGGPDSTTSANDNRHRDSKHSDPRLPPR
jgi:hypothetical protein